MFSLAENNSNTKYILVIFNLIFMITGLILIINGLDIGNIFDEYEPFLVYQYNWLTTATVAVGSVVITISLFACWSALKESYSLNLTFYTLLALTSIVTLAAGTCGYVLKEFTQELIKEPMNNSFFSYDPHLVNDDTSLWDYVQKSFTCCGLDSYMDWLTFNDQLPLSCCFIPNGVMGNFSCTPNNEDTNRFFMGCFSNFSEYIEALAYNLATIGVALGVILFLGVIFSCYLGRYFKRSKDVRDHKIMQKPLLKL